jgi:hypothetical protein
VIQECLKRKVVLATICQEQKMQGPGTQFSTSLVLALALISMSEEEGLDGAEPFLVFWSQVGSEVLSAQRKR